MTIILQSNFQYSVETDNQYGKLVNSTVGSHIKLEDYLSLMCWGEAQND